MFKFLKFLQRKIFVEEQAISSIELRFNKRNWRSSVMNVKEQWFPKKALTVLIPTAQPYRPSSKRPSVNFFRSKVRFGIIHECVSIFQKTLRAMWGKNACEN